jgi:hypothetical protein
MEDTMNEAPRRRGKRPEEVSEQVSSIPRADMRAEMREESSADRAKRRAAEIRGHLGGLDDGTDEFYVDLNSIPDGWTYEWKRQTILGAEDPTYTVHLARMGWEPVPSSRHPEMMPSDWAKGTIERKGLILMERPTEVVDEARRLQDRAARDQVRAKEAQLSGTPDGTMTRDHEKVRPAIKKSFEAMPVPKD